MALLIAYAKFLSRTDLSTQAVLRLLQLSLFLKRDLNDLIRVMPPDQRTNDPRQVASTI